MEARIALAACVVLGSGLCGKAAADAARRRLKALASLTEALRALRFSMTGMLQPVQLALGKSGNALLALVAGAMGSGRSAGEAWRSVRGQAVRRGSPADALSGEDLAVLDDLFERLGQSGRSEQEALLAASLQRLESRREDARKRAGEADRLYVSLGVLVGLMLALIVI